MYRFCKFNIIICDRFDKFLFYSKRMSTILKKAGIEEEEEDDSDDSGTFSAYRRFFTLAVFSDFFDDEAAGGTTTSFGFFKLPLLVRSDAWSSTLSVPGVSSTVSSSLSPEGISSVNVDVVAAGVGPQEMSRLKSFNIAESLNIGHFTSGCIRSRIYRINNEETKHKVQIAIRCPCTLCHSNTLNSQTNNICLSTFNIRFKSTEIYIHQD